MGFHDLAVSPCPPDPSCAARGGGAADRGDSNLPGLVTGSVVASSLQDVGSAHSEASSLSSMPQLPGFHPQGGIQYRSFGGSPHQGLPFIESDNAVVLNHEDVDFLSHHIATNTTKKYNSACSSFVFSVMI